MADPISGIVFVWLTEKWMPGPLKLGGARRLRSPNQHGLAGRSGSYKAKALWSDRERPLMTRNPYATK